MNLVLRRRVKNESGHEGVWMDLWIEFSDEIEDDDDDDVGTGSSPTSSISSSALMSGSTWVSA